MSSSYPSTIQAFVDVAGTTQLSNDHATLHNTTHDTVEALQTILGTTAGTAVLKNFTQGDFAVRMNSGGAIQDTASIATGAEIITGSEDAKIVTPKAVTDASASGAEVTTGTAVKLVTAKALGDAGVNTRLKSKVIQITRDMTAGDGDISYTGVGFTPTSMIVLSIAPSGAGFSAGIVDSAKNQMLISQKADGSMLNSSSEPIFIEATAGAYQEATLKTYDADGFTLTWHKGGSPTGTAIIHVLCLK